MYAGIKSVNHQQIVTVLRNHLKRSRNNKVRQTNIKLNRYIIKDETTKTKQYKKR